MGDISLQNYTDAFKRAPVATFVFNSVLVTGVTVVLSLLLCSAAGFAFVLVNWKGRDTLLALLLATLILPFETIAIPLLMMVAHPRGPWRIAPGAFLDGAEPCRRYAARIVDGPQGLMMLGFAESGKATFGGCIMDPEPVSIGLDGLLHVETLAQAVE